MSKVKQTFKDKSSKSIKSQMGNEFGGATTNDPKKYPQTGQWKFVKPEVSAVCIACEMCVKNCPDAVIEIKTKEGKRRAVIDYEYCKGCGICAEICPIKAIRMV